MSVRIGKFAKVMLGAVTIAEIGSYTISGITVDTVDITAFGDTAKDFIPTMIDPGDITINGNYDPSDLTGQIALEAAVAAGTEYGAGQVKFYLDGSTYLTPKGSGKIIFTKSKAISMDKAGVGTVSFSAKLSGDMLEQLNN